MIILNAVEIFFVGYALQVLEKMQEEVSVKIIRIQVTSGMDKLSKCVTVGDGLKVDRKSVKTIRKHCMWKYKLQKMV